MKFLTYFNWALIIFYGYSVIWGLLQPTTPSHEMPGAEAIIKVTGVLILIAMIAMNMSSYQWLKITATILGVIIILIIRWFSDN